MTDRFEGREPHLAGPAQHGFAVTPHNTNLISETTRGLYVGGAGDLVLVFASGAQITVSSVPGGTVLPVRVTKVLATGTTATALVGLV
jgi:hypothetical protein